MDVTITPFSNLTPLTRTSDKSSPVYKRNRFTPHNLLNRNLLNHSITPRSKSKLSFPSSAANKLRSTNQNNLIPFTKKNTNQPRLSIKITSNLIQPAKIVQPSSVADKKGVFLYQQIERNKMFTNGAELINRFHFKL